MECTADETVDIVTIDCLSNRPLDSVFCSFDDGLIHPCELETKLIRVVVVANHVVLLFSGELPISVSDQTFNVGGHTVSIVAMDSIGFTARDVVDYILNKSRINCMFSEHVIVVSPCFIHPLTHSLA